MYAIHKGEDPDDKMIAYLFKDHNNSVEIISDDQFHKRSSIEISKYDVEFVKFRHYSIRLTDVTMLTIWKDKKMTKSVLLIAILIPVLLVVCILPPLIILLVRYCRNRVIRRPREIEIREIPVYLESITSKFKKRYFKEEFSMKSNKFKLDTCSICMCNFKHADSVIDLKCHHLFHEDCINQWVSSKAKISKEPIRCPNCNIAFI